MKEAPQSYLPPEIWCTIFSYVPYYRLLGYSKVQSVCHSWNDELSLPKYHVPIDAREEALIRSCHTAEDALYVLVEPSLYKMLCFYEYLQIVALNESLCRWLLRPARRGIFKGLAFESRMFQLARPHLALVKNLLRDKEFISSFSSTSQCQLVSNHASLIDEILQTSSINLTVNDICILLWNHLENWKDHLEKLHIVFSELEEPSLRMLGLLSEEFADKIISNDICLQKLSSSSLADLGEKHLNIALKIIGNEVYLAKVGGSL